MGETTRGSSENNENIDGSSGEGTDSEHESHDPPPEGIEGLISYDALMAIIASGYSLPGLEDDPGQEPPVEQADPER